MNTGVIVLAAGRSQRFGSDKRSVRLPDGRQMINATVSNARASGLPLLVCLGPDDHQLAADLVAPGISCLQCRHAADGMGATLAEGIRSIGQWDGALVALADMPWILPGTYQQVAMALTRETIVQPHYRNEPGHPVGFGAEFFAALGALTGDVGGRHLLAENPDKLRRVDVTDAAIHRDVDRPRDIRG
ncbi:MAG: nucleotidyltransferase family protein [Halioglobus sp.]|nr:nucleotidyltransferase family protein [Halioglobus sp.]